MDMSSNPTSGLRVLIADDSSVSRHLLEATLRKWGYQVVAVEDGEKAWKVLQRDDRPDVVILDWVMPGLTGPEVCRLVRRQNTGKYTYLILLTSKSLKQELIEGMEAGADDYLTKPFDQHELQVRLRAGVRVVDLQTQLMEAREELREQATKDTLTRIWNRRSILDLLDAELSRIRRNDSMVGLIMLDLDHFKDINDTYGHLAGDEVLRESAKRLRGAIRQYDSIGRYGGEEFLIVMPGCGGPDIENQAERLRTTLCATPISIGDRSIIVTASFGTTYATPSCRAPQTSLIRSADEALYLAKRRGRNRVESNHLELAKA